MTAERRCPDDGACHHACGTGSCFRVVYCAPLSGYGERWTAEDRAENPPGALAAAPDVEAFMLGIDS